MPAAPRPSTTLLARLVPEDQIHRVDHFLGMSTVLNIVGMRFANRMLEPVLNAEHVDSVDILFDESLGLEGRAGYYDGAGALVDMIQSHCCRCWPCLPWRLRARSAEGPARRHGTGPARRPCLGRRPGRVQPPARYTEGDRRPPLPAYVDEDGVDPSRQTETLAEVVLAVDTWRWAGVPFRLRAGKALARRARRP